MHHESNKKELLKVSFSTQKGGWENRRLPYYFASVLHYRLGYNVLVMDCDFPQYSLSNMRERDKKQLCSMSTIRRLL